MKIWPGTVVWPAVVADVCWYFNVNGFVSLLAVLGTIAALAFLGFVEGEHEPIKARLEALEQAHADLLQYRFDRLTRRPADV
jgi:hypothetical protein